MSLQERVNENRSEHNPEKWKPFFRKDYAPRTCGVRRAFDAAGLQGLAIAPAGE
jgi:hypothetical protein